MHQRASRPRPLFTSSVVRARRSSRPTSQPNPGGYDVHAGTSSGAAWTCESAVAATPRRRQANAPANEPPMKTAVVERDRSRKIGQQGPGRVPSVCMCRYVPLAALRDCQSCSNQVASWALPDERVMSRAVCTRLAPPWCIADGHLVPPTRATGSEGCSVCQTQAAHTRTLTRRATATRASSALGPRTSGSG